MKRLTKLLTVGEIAQRLSIPVHRVEYVLSTRKRIVPSAIAGRSRVFNSKAVTQIEQELNAIGSQITSGGGK